MDRLDFSKDLNAFSYMYKNKNSDIFTINDESQKEYSFQDYIILCIIGF